jgi:hypothetical protein
MIHPFSKRRTKPWKSISMKCKEPFENAAETALFTTADSRVTPGEMTVAIQIVEACSELALFANVL